MATTIKLKNGSGAPLAGDLVQGEPALDLTNKRLYTEDSGGTVIEVGTNPGTDVTFADNRKAIFGAGSDLQIYHNGSHSFITDAGTGNLKIRGSNHINLESSDGSQPYIIANGPTGWVKLHYAGSEKLITTSTGIDVTGDVNSDSVTTGTFTSTGIDDNATSTAITIDASENVGIGTTVPDKTLVVSGAGAEIAINDTDTTDTPRLRFRESGTTSGSISTDAGEMRFDTGTTERMRIDSSGNVCIGDTSPQMRLHVAKNDSASTTDVARFSNSQMSSSFNAGAKIYIGDDSLASRQLELSLEGNGSSEFYAFLRTKEPGGLLALGNATDAYAVTLDSNGDLGVGNSNPLARLHITQTEASVGETDPLVRFERFTTGDNHFLDIGVDNSNNLVSFKSTGSSDGGFTFEGSSTEHMRITSSGNVGIGQTSPAYPLDVKADSSLTFTAINIEAPSDTGFSHVFFSDSTNAIGRVSYDHSANSMSFRINNATAMTIDSSGNLLVGRTNGITFGSNTTDGIVLQSNRLDVSAASVARITQIRDSSGTLDRFYNGASIVGSISCTTSATTYNTSSDQRLKENIVDAPAGNIDAIRVRSFDWKADGSHQTYGMVAQELVDVAPEAVTQGATDDDMWQVDYSKLVPMMIKEIQDLKAEVAALKGA